jgi:NADH-quinone oxidoreductase subunit C
LPDATGLELIAQSVRESLGDEAVVGTDFSHDEATLQVAPERIRDVLGHLSGDWPRLTSVHGNDYLPDEPRFGVHYYLLSMERGERLHVKVRLTGPEPRIASVVDMFPTADFQEREVYDMFGVEFDGHPDLRRILMPEDYVGFPQRRDFPMGGEPVIFTFNEHKLPRWYE